MGIAYVSWNQKKAKQDVKVERNYLFPRFFACKVSLLQDNNESPMTIPSIIRETVSDEPCEHHRDELVRGSTCLCGGE